MEHNEKGKLHINENSQMLANSKTHNNKVFGNHMESERVFTGNFKPSFNFFVNHHLDKNMFFVLIHDNLHIDVLLSCDLQIS
jgi:hypothetical protein